MKFRTKAPHYLPGDRWVDAETDVGDETNFPLPEDYIPSAAMEGLDGDGKKLVKQLRERRDPESEIARRTARGKLRAETNRAEAENEDLQNQIEELKNQLRQLKQQQRAEVGDAAIIGQVEPVPGAAITTPALVEGVPQANVRKSLTEVLSNTATASNPDGGVTQPEVAGQTPTPAVSDEAQTPKPSSRPGAQNVDNPNKDLPAADKENYTHPGSPNAPGPSGVKAGPKPK